LSPPFVRVLPLADAMTIGRAPLCTCIAGPEAADKGCAAAARLAAAVVVIKSRRFILDMSLGLRAV
jgi:hypothetical protein